MSHLQKQLGKYIYFLILTTQVFVHLYSRPVHVITFSPSPDIGALYSCSLPTRAGHGYQHCQFWLAKIFKLALTADLGKQK